MEKLDSLLARYPELALVGYLPPVWMAGTLASSMTATAQGVEPSPVVLLWPTALYSYYARLRGERRRDEARAGKGHRLFSPH